MYWIRGVVCVCVCVYIVDKSSSLVDTSFIWYHDGRVADADAAWDTKS